MSPLIAAILGFVAGCIVGHAIGWTAGFRLGWDGKVTLREPIPSAPAGPLSPGDAAE
jgi:hypothetical protein